MKETDDHNKFIDRAIELSRKALTGEDGGPFGCVIVKDNQIIAEGYNKVTNTNDPTAHAEIVAIREACRVLNSFQLNDCIIYTSCEPCPMCFGAIYWARPKAVFFANTKNEAAAAGFDDSFIYEEIDLLHSGRKIPFTHLPNDEGKSVFEDWLKKTNKKEY